MVTVQILCAKMGAACIFFWYYWLVNTVNQSNQHSFANTLANAMSTQPKSSFDIKLK